MGSVNVPITSFECRQNGSFLRIDVLPCSEPDRGDRGPGVELEGCALCPESPSLSRRRLGLQLAGELGESCTRGTDCFGGAGEHCDYGVN